MDLKQELTDYEIGGIGDIKKHTLRFRSYRIGTEGGKLMIYAEYEMGCPPKVFDGYPSGQELLIDLCNLYQELREKPLEECAQILIRWSMEISICTIYMEAMWITVKLAVMIRIRSGM